MRVYMRKRYRRLKREASARRRWSLAELAQLREQYPHMKTAVIAAMLERPLYTVYQAARRLGIEKSPEYLASPAACRLRRGDQVGKPYRYPKGHVPANKGLRRPGWAPGRMKETQFKPGQQNHNAMPVGSTRLVDGYIYIKVAAVRYVPYTVNWLPLHILGWERAHGPLPPRHCLWFRDGNRMNVDVANLELITRGENMRRNSLHNLPKPLAELVQLRGALMRQINRKERDGSQRDRGPQGNSLRHAAGSPQQRQADGDRPGEGSGRGRARAHRLGKG